MEILLTFGTGLYLFFVILIIIGLSRLTFHKHSKIDIPKVSVIIAARNEEDNLPLLLGDLVQQTISDEKLEIIIANDRSTDNTVSIVEGFILRYPFINMIFNLKMERSCHIHLKTILKPFIFRL